MPTDKSASKRRRQRGGLLPLAALVPALLAVGKAAALGAVGGPRVTAAKKPWKRRPLGRKTTTTVNNERLR